MAEPDPKLGQPESTTTSPRRTRRRSESLKLDKVKVAERIEGDYTTDLQDRIDWNDQRVQRYAKLRGWLDRKLFPWEDAANNHVSILMQDSLHLQDSIFNASMTSMPPITSKALHKGDVNKEESVDKLIAHQVFIEQGGEEKIATLGDTFVNDGTMFAMTAWVREDQVISDLHIFDPLPSGASLKDYLDPLFREMFKAGFVSIDTKDGWSWTVTVRDTATGRNRDINIEVYIPEEDGRVEVVETGKRRVFDGPVFFPKCIEDWTIPFRAENPQPPGPSNPQGASHVNLVDPVSLDEVRRLAKSGFYDLITQEELKKLAGEPEQPIQNNEQNEEIKILKDDLEGTQHTGLNDEETPPKLTRITWFGGLDIDGDGLEEQVVIRMIRETKTILRARLLTEEYPGDRPKRPLMMRSLIPVPGRAYGISLLELLEPLYDQMKMILDQLVDSGTIRNMPWGLVKSQSGFRNEPIRIAPGTFYPTANPQQDLHVVQMATTADALFTNLITIYSQWADQLTMAGELQFGQIPSGKASALRTVGGMLSVLQQGDARPEHILRRYFSGLAEIWAMFHDLNQAFLPKDKEVRIVGLAKPGEEVYQTISDRNMISGRFQFDFKATVLNTSKGMLAQALQQLLAMMATPFMLQMGIAQPEGIYRTFRELFKALGQDPDGRIFPPSPDAMKLKLSAQEALTMILNNREPDGIPMEPTAREHIEAMNGIPEFYTLTAAQQIIFQRWLQQVMLWGRKQTQQQQMMQAAQQFQQSVAQMGNNGGGRPPEIPSQLPVTGPAGNAPTSGNELISEQLPSSGGGGNAAAI